MTYICTLVNWAPPKKKQIIEEQIYYILLFDIYIYYHNILRRGPCFNTDIN